MHFYGIVGTNRILFVDLFSSTYQSDSSIGSIFTLHIVGSDSILYSTWFPKNTELGVTIEYHLLTIQPLNNATYHKDTL